MSEKETNGELYSQVQIDEINRLKQVSVPWTKLWAWNLGFVEENRRAPTFNEVLEMVRKFDATPSKAHLT